MNALRHPVLQRVVALLLFAGAGLASAPPVAAAAAASLGEDDLREALGESEALDQALRAARRASTPAAAADAFVRTYTALTGEDGAARDLSRLLLDHAGFGHAGFGHAGFGAPALPRGEAVWASAGASTPLDRTASAVLGAERTERPASVCFGPDPEGPRAVGHTARRSQRTRAP